MNDEVFKSNKLCFTYNGVLTLNPKGKSMSVESLAEMQKLSPTYLSKILTKLVKAGLIESNPGVNGGYRISKRPMKYRF